MPAIHRPEFLPSEALSRAEMEALQHEIAETAEFETADVTSVDDALVAGVDQAFREDQAVSVIVVRQDNETVEQVHATAKLTIPYIPGLLAFREGPPILNAFRSLEFEPDVVLFDGSGRIHYRQAGLATHIGVLFDIPTIGVAKRLLCGTPREPVDDLPAGSRVAIEADADVTASPETVLGYAVQTRQYTSGSTRINPLYVSPGHRMDAETAADLVLSTATEYKLPTPIRLADQLAAESATPRE